MKKKLFQIGFILLLAILVSTGINFSLKKNQSNFSLGVANIEALATGEIDVNIDFSFKEANYFYCRCRDLDGGSARCTGANALSLRRNCYKCKNTGLYYSENLTMALLSIDSGKVEKLICNYPLIYQKQKNLVNFKFSLFDTYEKRFLYSYEADSLIYCMNLGDTTITSFGIAGKDMNQNYKQYFTLNDASHNFSKDRNKFGYYHSIVIDPHHDLVFRTYRKGEHSPYDGLQVYQQNCLIADYQTPKNFTFLGYISPWFYASGPLDYDNEQMIIYRFNLNDL